MAVRISMMARLKELEAENQRLSHMYAEERLKAAIAREAIEEQFLHLSNKKYYLNQALNLKLSEEKRKVVSLRYI